MKGVIFNLLQEVIGREFGDEVWDSLLESAKLEGVYTSLGIYPDAELMKLVGTGASAQNKSVDEMLRWFGAAAIPLLATKFPVFFKGHRSTGPFLLTLNDVIHEEVRKLYPGVDVPKFDYEDVTEQGLVMIYRSARKLCALAEGFIQGAAIHYGEEVVVTQSACMMQGASRCVLHVSFPKRAG